ncbi:S-phase kinase-associated protein 1-like [Paramacrobiotus metropolitanus]|uniref:S-phase kinase-associated protein 1-like n=1 Tax=Paramacrobiotus metropolitanus TaxID=2943436 RepID=UPI002445892F|nr:S-phase kinase-associated protein 1-like [Paramacrobiotus metropolitanus]
MDQKVTLESKDEHTIEVELNAIKHSKLIKEMLTNLGQWPNADGSPSKPIKEGDESIPLAEVKFSVLEKIVEWLNQYKDQPELAEDEESVILRRLDDVADWDKEWLGKMRRGQIYELVQGANYMNVRGLVESCCKTIASWLKNKTAEQIREEFGIKNDFTPEEEERIRRETEWCEPDRDLI